MNRRARRRAVLLSVITLVWAASRAGFDDVVNVDGFGAFGRFWRSMLTPELSRDFVELTIDSTATTAAYAILGSAVALLLGAAGSLLISERAVGARWLRRSSTMIAAIPRSVHEVLIALFLLQVFGFDPIVAVLAIGIPFGAVTAKVYADAIDDADRSGFDALRVSGAGRLSAIAYGIVPDVRGEMISYGFYRLECAIRSAAVLGIVGVGGLGFQLDVSFESLRYAEMWTLIFALMLLSGTADAMSSAVRRRGTARWTGWSLAVIASMSIAWSAWKVGLDVSVLWSERTLERAPEFIRDVLPPTLGPGGWSELWSATVDTVALAVLAIAVATSLGLVGAVIVRRTRVDVPTSARRLVAPVRRFSGKWVLLLARAVPAPVWAFLFVLVLYPGLWPGAVALGIYNAGVLGRLYAEALENQPVGAELGVTQAGARWWGRWAYAILPGAAPRLVSLTAYRAEVLVRETIVIGVVGAGGLGQLVRDHLAARDFAAVTGIVIVLVGLAVAADALGSAMRSALG